MLAGLDDLEVALADVEVDDAVADADELTLVDLDSGEEVEEEEPFAAEGFDAVVEDVSTIHWLFWHL